MESERSYGMRRRRADRQERKKTRRRSLIIRLSAAAGILILCVTLIVLFAGNQKEPSTQTVTAPSGAVANATQSDVVVHVAAVGDLNISDAVVAAGGEEYDYANTFLDVAHLLGDADVTVVNLEGNLVGEPYGSAEMSAPQSMMETLNAVGVDLVQLANSYSIYHGISGLSATIDGVRKAGMEPLGVFSSEEDYQEKGGYTIVSARGIRIAFVAFTKGMDGMTLPPGNENCVNVLYSDYDSTYRTLNQDKINTIMDAVEAEKPDVTVAMLHWGSAYNNTVSTSQQEICELLQSRGVSAIIGTHSHYVQKMEYDPEKGTFVAYSLGDFLSDAQESGTEYSVVLDLEFTRDGATGKTKLTGYSYTPIFTVAEEGQPLRVVRINEAMAAFEGGYLNCVTQETYDKMKYALTRIRQRVAGE